MSQQYMNDLLHSSATNESLPYFGRGQSGNPTKNEFGMMSEAERLDYEINYHSELLEKQHALPKPKSEYSAFFQTAQAPGSEPSMTQENLLQFLNSQQQDLQDPHSQIKKGKKKDVAKAQIADADTDHSEIAKRIKDVRSLLK